MSTASNSSTASGSRPTSRSHDTGFPDSFAYYTTSLRHPDAIVDPGFSISAEDVDANKALHRSRRHLLAKHRRTISHGKIAQGLNQQHPAHSMSQLQLPTDSAVQVGEGKTIGMGDGIKSPSREGAENIDRFEASSVNGDYSPTSQFEAVDKHDNEEERHRSKLFGHWRSPKY
ncbi:Uu.00g101140.m01.CDS01 [Anthostomella pinea]|uniref:Uu.00g101140.m01.CDS01 n=1 Tax=Anthostomella pinea TaxID=933095 RepID=A0AAI8VD00_9PEZI|nr:Uu.00g101140.m01.CDS01 [Anthostomella pinea]